MVGDGRKYLAALITLAEQPLKDVRSRPGGINGVQVRDEQILGQVRSQVDAVNLTLASYEQIKKFTVLSREFTVEDGEMTPTLKVKRSVIEKRYHDVIEQMYQ
jgi:long-chain acyl-CoA synthetase